MNPLLLLFLIIIGNLCLYWIFFGKNKFENKLNPPVDTNPIVDVFEKKVGENDVGQDARR